MVISSVGNISFEKWLKIIVRYFGDIPTKQGNDRELSHNFTPGNITKKKHFPGSCTDRDRHTRSGMNVVSPCTF